MHADRVESTYQAFVNENVMSVLYNNYIYLSQTVSGNSYVFFVLTLQFDVNLQNCIHLRKDGKR